MTPIALIAANFLREQRWYVVVLLLWVFIIAGFVLANGRVSGDDLVFLLRQQTVYGLALTMFMASAAIQNERRTRRILAVLSKAVSRGQYLAGLLCGATAVAAIFFVAMGASGQWITARLHLPGAWALMWPLIAASALLAAYGLLFATFLHPLLASLLSAGALGIQYLVERASGPAIASWLPLYGIANSVMTFRFDRAWSAPTAASWLAVAEAVALWLLASSIFARRDIAVAVE